MYHVTNAGYAGAVSEDAYAGYTTTHSFFCTLEVFGGFSKQQGTDILSQLQLKIETELPDTLKKFDAVVSHFIEKTGLPVDFSLSAGFLHNHVLYLKTVGSGEIYIRRGNKTARIIGSNTIASGYVLSEDMFIFSSSVFMEGSRGEAYLTKLFHNTHDPMKLVEHLTEDPIEGRDEVGVVLFALFNKDHTKTDQSMPSNPPHRLNRFPLSEWFHVFVLHKKKVAMMVFIVGILVILLFNIQNLFRQKGKSSISITTTQQQIQNELKTLDGEVDMDRALGVLIQLRKQVSDLKKITSKKDLTDILHLEQLVNQTESKVLRREEKSASEFYDLALEEKSARADRIALADSHALILNTDGKIYKLSLDTKSIEKKAYGEIANADVIAGYDDSIFFYRSGAGVYQIEKESKPKRIIENDTEWGNIIDMCVYNGNIYILDSGKDEIFKYLVTSEGYSGKNSYVQSGSSTQFKKAHSLSIDAAVYVGFDSFIIKYLSGNRESFKSQFPGDDAVLYKSYTDKNLDNVYALDKTKSVIYILTKEGEYVKQIHNALLAKAQGFVVYKQKAYILMSAKIFMIEL